MEIGSLGENGNWRCPACHNVNFSHRSECNRCAAQKPEDVPGIQCGSVEWKRKGKKQLPSGNVTVEKWKSMFSYGVNQRAKWQCSIAIYVRLC